VHVETLWPGCFSIGGKTHPAISFPAGLLKTGAIKSRRIVSSKTAKNPIFQFKWF